MGHGQILQFSRSKQNTVDRYNERATYELQAIHEIVNTASVLHVSFNAAGGEEDPLAQFPSTLPMVGIAASFEYPSAGLNEPLDIYVHGYVSARLMNTSRNHVNGEEKGLPVCVTATIVDGIVLSLTPYTHDINYRSAILYGYATVVKDEAEKMWAMEQITNSVVAGRWQHSRVPPDGAEIQSTSILKVHVVSGSGKVHTGGPKDVEKDMSKEEMRQGIWTGVLPMWEVIGSPIASKSNLVAETPEHVSSYANDITARNETYARNAAREE